MTAPKEPTALKSLGEKLLDAVVSVSGPVESPSPEIMSRMERVALAFCAALTHDETATATIEALRGEVEAWKREANKYRQALVEAVNPQEARND